MKILIVGAGPAGSIAGRYLAKADMDVTIIEEHGVPGFPVQCAGLISEKCIRLTGINIKKVTENIIDGMCVHGPSGRYIELRSKHNKGYVIERKLFDQELLKVAIKKGAKIKVKTRFVDASNGKARIISSGTEQTDNYDILLGCDGVQSTVAKQTGFNHSYKVFSGAQIEGRFECHDRHMVELFFGSSASPDFFGYAIPINEEIARIGVVAGERAHIYLKKMLESHKGIDNRFRGSHLEINVGGIPIGLMERLVDPEKRVMLIGDSAGQVKPYTGGGIYYGALGAKFACEAITKFRDSGDPDALINYEQGFIEEVGKELETGMRLLALYSSLTDDDYDTIIEILSQESIKNLISEKGDMDRPSTLVRELPQLLRNFKYIKLMGKIARHFLIS
jgi:geranylgeranyl reductase family protein